jgi:soluble lytic murein transglycosylase-like protein
MRCCKSSHLSRVVISIALIIFGAASTRLAHAQIFGMVGAGGATLLTNAPGQPGLSVIVAGDATPKHGGKQAEAASRREGATSRFAAVIAEASRTIGVEPALLQAVIRVESRYNPNALSKTGARGLMQLMPETARRFSDGDMFNPRDNVFAGARYLRFLLDRFDEDIELALAAYNAGENAVIRAGYRIPPFPETQAYVPAVMAHYRRLLSGA